MLLSVIDGLNLLVRCRRTSRVYSTSLRNSDRGIQPIQLNPSICYLFFTHSKTELWHLASPIIKYKWTNKALISYVTADKNAYYLLPRIDCGFYIEINDLRASVVHLSLSLAVLKYILFSRSLRVYVYYCIMEEHSQHAQFELETAKRGSQLI